MKHKVRHICPTCGSVKIDVTPKVMVCLNCGHRAPKFPSSTDPVASPETWDRREREDGRILPKGGAE